MYRMKRKVTYSEVGADYLADMAQVIDYFQDCSCFHSDSLNVGPRSLTEHGKAWVLNSWQIVAKRYPSYGEEICVDTWAYEFKAMMGKRNFVIVDAAGEPIVTANSIWAYMDMEKGRPVQPEKGLIEAYGLEPRIGMDYAPRRIRTAGDFEKLTPMCVERAFLDTNHHMNNSRYVEVAMEYLPENFQVGQLRVEYRRSAVYKDILIPERQIDGQKLTIKLSDSDGEPYVITEFTDREIR